MTPIRADFLRSRQPPRWAWLGAGLLVASTLVAAGLAWREHVQVQSLRGELQALRASQAAVPAHAVVQAPPPPYDASARAMLLERALPWPQALTTLEAMAIVGVTPIAFEAVAADRSWRLEVAFVDYAKLLEYVEALNAGEPNLRWTLSQSQAHGAGGASAIITGTVERR
jgi:hypothetical protein